MIQKVSVIIPTYNRMEYLIDSVESALSQDYQELEVIVSDNASTDNTEDRMKKYTKDSRFRYFRNEKNLGMVGNQRKALFDYATGEWAIVLDSDDYFIDSSYIRDAMELVRQDDSVVLVHANFRKYNVGLESYEDVRKGLPEVVDGKWMFLNYRYGAMGRINYDKLTVIFNRKIAIVLDVFDDDIPSSDRDCFLRISLRGKVAFLDRVVAVYRIHGGNLALTDGEDSFFENLRAVTTPYKYAMDSGSLSKRKLDRWKRRMIRDACEVALLNRMIKGENRKAFLKDFTRRLYYEYPFALGVLFRLLGYKTLGRIVLRVFRDSFQLRRVG